MSRKLWYLAPVFAGTVFWAITMAPADLLPHPIAIHWSLVGEPDGFATLELAAGINAAVGFLFGAIFAFVNLGKIQRFARRVLNLVLLAMLIPISLILFSAVYLQVGLASGAEARFPIWLFAITSGVAALLIWAFLAWPSLSVSGGEVAVRLRGITAMRLSLSEVREIRPAEVRASDFGGWGMRVNSRGEVAFIPKSGPALRLETFAGEVVFIRLRDPQAELEKFGAQ